MTSPNDRIETNDPIVARRERIDRLNKIATRTGYALYAISTVTFFVGLQADYASVMHLVSGVSLVVGSVILAPSIVITYGIRAARREDAKVAHESKAAAQEPSAVSDTSR